MKFIITTIFLFTALFVCSQDLQFNVKGNYAVLSSSSNARLFHNDGAIELQYGLGMQKFDLLFSGGLRVINWGNQIDLSVGIRKDLIIWKRFRWDISAKPYLGIPLFYNEALISVGAELNSGLKYLVSNKFQVGVLGGLRYDILPRYKLYGSIYSITGLQYGVSVIYVFGKNKDDVE